MQFAASVGESSCRRCATVHNVPYVHIVGSMCFTCGKDPDGMVCKPALRDYARAKMIRRISGFVATARAGAFDASQPWETGDMHPAGVELAALLARAPEDVTRRALAALRPHLPADVLARVAPADLVQDDQTDRA